MLKYILIALTLSACGLKQTADEMKSSTDEIRDNSRQMPQMREDTGHLAKRTDDLEYEGTYDRTTTVMQENMSQLWRENLPLGKSYVLPNGESDQLVYAGVTVKSMWFQFWKGDYRETIADLDQRLDEGTRILFTRAMTHTPADGHVGGLLGYVPDYSWTGVAALGASLDYVSDRYKEAALKAGIKNYTYYDVVMQALRIRNGSTEATPFPRTVKRLRSYGKIVEYMVQLRHNFLPVMVACFLTDFKDQWMPGRAISTFWGQKASLAHVDSAQLEEWTMWLRNAKQTRMDLRAAGIEPKFNPLLRRMLKNVDFGQARLLAQPFDRLGPVERAQAEFAAAYADVTLDDPPEPPAAAAKPIPPPPRPEHLLPSAGS